MSPLWEAIHAIRAKRLVIVKTNRNTAMNSKYADIGDMKKVLSPALDELKLAYALEPGKVRIAEGCLIQILHFKVTMAGESEVFEREIEWVFPGDIVSGRTGGSAVNISMRQGMALTYARRYIPGSFFEILFGDDDDAQKLSVKDAESIPGIITVKEDTKWQSLVDGMWVDVMSPLCDGKLKDHAAEGLAHMNELWQEYPSHPGLIAYFADWLTGRMLDLQLPWRTLHEGSSLPEHMASCIPAELREAIRLFKKLKSQSA